ncbi:hypothetical protein D8674_042369 [Pyrus ussuriensis x Pyrus communis]|uniref:Uncharacterized protein n=1 Tax=Pyrus ussuriensis x Pyrus communis TaxID=2448454 RepID=A0A5N5GKS1_9ROSA|nr:hypothetical protein D8674_042369 [Pyrus ussuriensis x Pyrus communis]
MADSVSDSTKCWDGEGSREGKVSTELRFDIGGLVRKQCSTEFKSWKMVPVDLKNSKIQDLSQRNYVDDLFKMQFRQWKFNIQRVAAVADAPIDDPKEE